MAGGMRMLNLFPEEISKIMAGKRLLAHAVIEEETRSITNNSFVNAQYAWNAYSIYPNWGIARHYTNPSYFNDCWLEVMKSMQHDYVHYCCVYLLDTQQAVLIKVKEPVINDYFDVDFYVCDLKATPLQFEMVESYIRYHMADKLWVSMPRIRKTSCGMTSVYKAGINDKGLIYMKSIMFKKGYIRNGTDYYGTWDIWNVNA
jgi:hypothetical protein